MRNRGRRRCLAILAKIVVRTVGVHALVSDAPDVLLAAIADDVGVSNAKVGDLLEWVDDIAWRVNFDQSVTRVSLGDMYSARLAAVPVGAGETLVSNASNGSGALVAGGRMSDWARHGCLLLLDRLDSTLEPLVWDGGEDVLAGMEARMASQQGQASTT
jgi:hypothetical protein